MINYFALRQHRRVLDQILIGGLETWDMLYAYAWLTTFAGLYVEDSKRRTSEITLSKDGSGMVKYKGEHPSYMNVIDALMHRAMSRCRSQRSVRCPAS